MAPSRLDPSWNLLLLLLLLCWGALCSAASPSSFPRLGWGWQGHQMTAALAQPLLSSSSHKHLQTLLPAVDGQIARIASWADDIKNISSWDWAFNLHYINIGDWDCNYNYFRDCFDPVYGFSHCVDGAIQNYTGRLLDTKLSLDERSIALKFLVHFLGDIHQPLHVGFDSDEGGNTITGSFLGNETNLHAIWDFNIIEARLERDFKSQMAAWLKHLEGQMASLPAADKAYWLDCSYVSHSINPFAEKLDVCSSDWAQESAGLTCSNAEVDTDGNYKIKNHFKLGEEYYQKNLPVVEQRLMQGGLRLAHILNNIFHALDEQQDD